MIKFVTVQRTGIYIVYKKFSKHFGSTFTILVDLLKRVGKNYNHVTDYTCTGSFLFAFLSVGRSSPRDHDSSSLGRALCPSWPPLPASRHRRPAAHSPQPRFARPRPNLLVPPPAGHALAPAPDSCEVFRPPTAGEAVPASG